MTIKEMINNIGPNKLHTENGYEFFKLDSDGYYYVLNTETGRAARYNGEIQNGKRISTVDWMTAKDACICAMAEDPEVSVEEFAKMVAETEESNNTEAGKEIAKRMRKSKNTREVAGVALTEKQIDFIKHLPDTCFWEHGLDSCIWVDCLCDEIKGQFAGKPMTVGAMISTICEKGLGNRARDRINGKLATSFALTELGKAVAAELGLN